MSDYLTKVLALWFVYGAFGFIVETTYVSLNKKKFVQRGFLTGPIIPIYAFGALAILYFLSPWHKSVLLLFISGMLVASLLEYFGGYMMEKIFKIKLWDYSDYKYNIKGRVCLKNSIMFGVLAVLLVLYINPAVIEFIDSIDFKVLSYLVSIAMIIAIIDTSFSVFALIDIKKILHETIEASHIKRVKGSYKRSKARLHKAYPKMRVAVSDRINNKKNKY